MSALGHKQTCALQQAMSALPPKADMCGAMSNVCFGPIADMASGRDGFRRKATFIKFNQFSQRNNSFFP
jgi:hypothetical protein